MKGMHGIEWKRRKQRHFIRLYGNTFGIIVRAGAAQRMNISAVKWKMVPQEHWTHTVIISMGPIQSANKWIARGSVRTLFPLTFTQMIAIKSKKLEHAKNKRWFCCDVRLSTETDWMHFNVCWIFSAPATIYVAAADKTYGVQTKRSTVEKLFYCSDTWLIGSARACTLWAHKCEFVCKFLFRSQNNMQIYL